MCIRCVARDDDMDGEWEPPMICEYTLGTLSNVVSLSQAVSLPALCKRIFFLE